MSTGLKAPVKSRSFLFWGYLVLFLLVFGVGVWGAIARISGAVVAPGSVEVEGNRQVVQHPNGGVITEILARDGEEVKAGNVLIRLDGRDIQAELDIVEGQWFEILAREGRLSAERDGLDAIEFIPELIEEAGNRPELPSLMIAQVEQFEARRKLQGEETKQLQERQAQINQQITGLESLKQATGHQIDLLSREIENQEELLRQGLTQMTRVLTPQRELAELRGTLGQVEATIAENRGKIAEIEIELVRMQTQLREEAINDLRDLEYREIELRERRRTLKDQIARLELRAPVSGIVYASAADTIRGVIRAAEPVMYIVPSDIPLIVRTRIEPIHIDQVFVGQEATLRFSAFDARSTPEVSGTVSAVSADALEDPEMGLRFYRVEIELSSEMRDKLGEENLILPGMPVEAYIKTAERSPLGLFVRPMTDYFYRAFREG